MSTCAERSLRAHMCRYTLYYIWATRVQGACQDARVGVQRRKNRYAKTQESECENAGIGVRKRKIRYAKTQESECENAGIRMRKRRNPNAKTQESGCKNANFGTRKRKNGAVRKKETGLRRRRPQSCFSCRTRGRGRTGTSVTSVVFETTASTYSATWA